MELLCLKCKKLVVPVLSESGPHIKAECPKCGKYIKFISEKELVKESQRRRYSGFE